ncbi:MAG TPA: hypothetical protein VFR58_06615 [Flavisolibacter sp.]|nr:hypothetical protein [Flavisolibacter sp.]
MQIMKILALLTLALLIAACFLPWISIADRGIAISGFEATTADFGKPGLFHLVICSIYLLLVLIPKPWSLRIAFFVSTLNIAWALRNFILISACRGGICPDKHIGLYLVLICSLLLTVFTLFIRVKPKATRENDAAAAESKARPAV